MDLSIIIVNWNSCEYLKACLASIRTTVRRISFEIVVIDSGSFDGCGEMIREHCPTVRFIQLERNLGFAKANNLASEASSGECLLFLNPDTEIADGAIERMLAALSSLPDVGIVGCRLLNPDGTLQSSCVQSFPTIANQALNSEFLRRLWPKSPLWGMAPLFEPGPAAREVQGVSGACLMIGRSTFERIGRFSEDYFMYVEDLDLSYRVRQSGCRNYYVPTATVVHHGGYSSDRAIDTFAAIMTPEAIRRFLRTTRGPWYSSGYRIVMFLCAVLRLSLLGAVSVSGRSRPSLTISRRKWLAVLQWSLNRDRVVSRYYSDGPQSSLSIDRA